MSIRIVVLAGMAAVAVAGCSGNGSSGGGGQPTVSFTAPSNAATINLGQSLTLSWTSTGATSCTASTSGASAGSFSGAIATSGSQSVAPTAVGTASYTISCTGANGNGSATSPEVTVAANILAGLTSIATIGSTIDPIEMGGNPYGLVIAPATAGLITKGDLVVCNFNDGATNTQGDGTTIDGLHPVAGSSPYRIAQSAQLEGCNALTMLPDDSISAAAFVANLNPLVTASGTVNNPFAADTFAGPWGEAYVAATASQPAALYVSNVTGGTIDRITLNGDAQTAFTEIAKGFCGSGAPGAVYAPSGLTYDPSIDTLYIVDTSSNSVVSFTGVSKIGDDGILVDGGCSGSPPTPALSFSGPSASSAKVIATGGQFNGPISAALLSDGDLVVGNADLNGPPVTNLLFEISPALGFVGQPIQLDTGAPGALFGIVATTDSGGNTIIYFNDDNANTVMSLSAAPASTPPPAATTLTELQTTFFTPICSTCHTGVGSFLPGSQNLTAGNSFSNIVNVASVEVPSLDRIKPNDPTNSYLIQKIEGAPGIMGEQMPFGCAASNSCLTQTQINEFISWVNAGALNN
jgi:hypothetical protein